MTPDEQRMIQDLFQRLSAQGAVSKDPQADRVISDALRSNRDAGYMLVQTALVYEHQMEQQELRIRDLEDQIADLQSRGASAAPASGGGSFLGGRIGSNRGSVPGVASRDAAPAASPWQSAPQQQAAPQRSGWFGGGGQQAAPAPVAQAPAAAGGGFMRSALQTAAGVAGGMMVANSLSGLFGGGNNAHAAGADNSGALRDADSSQDELQDAQLESDAEQDSSQDASYDSGGGFDDIET